MMRRERAELRMTSEIARTVIPGNKRIESAVIAGLDPAIHLPRKIFWPRMMDPRVKPAGDVPDVGIGVYWLPAAHLVLNFRDPAPPSPQPPVNSC